MQGVRKSGQKVQTSSYKLVLHEANGATFKTMRKHLCKNLPGSAAWKDGRHD